MIKPIVGRVVWYHPPFEADSGTNEKTYAAFVCYVHNDVTINIAVFDENGTVSAKTSVHLVQKSNEPRPSFGYAEWMPYQQGQAATSAIAETKQTETSQVEVERLTILLRAQEFQLGKKINLLEFRLNEGENAILKEALRIACADAWPDNPHWPDLYIKRAKSKTHRRSTNQLGVAPK